MQLEVQNGTQQDLNKMIDLVNFFFFFFWGGGAKRSSTCWKWGASKWDPTRSEWIGIHSQIYGGKKIIQMPKMGGKTTVHTYWLSKRECPPWDTFMICIHSLILYHDKGTQAVWVILVERFRITYWQTSSTLVWLQVINYIYLDLFANINMTVECTRFHDGNSI